MSDDYRDYLFDYPFGGSRWSLTITAVSEDEARARLEAMRYARYAGELFFIVTVPGSAGLRQFLNRLRRAFDWFRQ
jgi:hypothetical protein